MLELPSAVPSNTQTTEVELFAKHDPTKSKIKTSRTNYKRKLDATVDESELADNRKPLGHEGIHDGGEPSALPSNQYPRLAFVNGDPPSNISNELQVMDLESNAPMIMFQDQMYSCQWSSSIGTDVLFIRRPDNVIPTYKASRSFEKVDLLGIGAARLVATRAAIEHTQDFTQQSSLDYPVITSNLDIGSEGVVRQATFLGQVADIKARRGEEVGNLKTLAEAVYHKSEDFDPRGKSGKTSIRGSRTARSPIAELPLGDPGTVASSH